MKVSTVALSLVVTLAAIPGSVHGSEEYTWTEFSYEPYPFAYFVDDVDRYEACTPPPEAVNRHGELEYLGDTIYGAHWFVEDEETTAAWHFVTAGDPDDEVVLFIHGYPDTWYAYKDTMVELVKMADYYIISVDTLGYGQSDKREEIDVSYGAVAESLISILDTKLGVDTFNLIAHDRGSVISDHLIAADGLDTRILAFVRMQQSFDQPHGLPRPPHALMATAEFQAMSTIRNIYASNYLSVDVPEEEVARFEWEFGFEGTFAASARTFQGTSFDIELDYRFNYTIPKMTMPVLIVQGTRDPAQNAEEYFRSAEVIPNGRVALVDANHFIHTEDPVAVATLAHDLFVNKNANRNESIFTHPVHFHFPERHNPAAGPPDMGMGMETIAATESISEAPTEEPDNSGTSLNFAVWPHHGTSGLMWLAGVTAGVTWLGASF